MTKYANLIGYSDINPYEVIKYTAKTITIREMSTVIDPSFKPNFIPGGFCGTVINQEEQNWKIFPNINGRVLKAYLHKDGRYHSVAGAHYLSYYPIKFYDYNF